jgi:hydroxymethylpyrimidine/phosphomethylpyrimidine kinase
MHATPPLILTVAGFDPSSGAGITADIKTIAAHGCYGMACITALTVQSTQGVREVVPLDPSLVSRTLDELAADVDFNGVKIGMLGSARVVSAVADFLQSKRIDNVVLDPILKASSGAVLLDEAGRELMVKRLLPAVSVVTPNLQEAAALTGLRVTNLEEMRSAARCLHERGVPHVVVTGGDLEKATDLLSFTTSDGGIAEEVFRAKRHDSPSTHGTGCAFASALACHLAQGRKIAESVLLAKAFVAGAIANAPRLGRGIGPVHHLYRMQQPSRVPSPVPEPEPVR